MTALRIKTEALISELHTQRPGVVALSGAERHAEAMHAVGVSPANGIGRPEARTREARFTAAPGPARLIPTHRGRGLHAAEIAALPTRWGSLRDPSYAPLTPQALTDHMEPHREAGPPI